SSLWPLGLALQVSAVPVAGWADPDSVGRAMGATTVAFLIVLLGLEQILPYRRDWAVRGDSGIWRDLRHSVLYIRLGAERTQIVFLTGLTAALSCLRIPAGLGLWPVGSSMLVQIAGSSFSETSSSIGITAWSIPCLGFGRCTRFITRPSDSTRSRAPDTT